MIQEIENGRLFRLMCKLGSVNERPHLSGSVGSNHDQSWAESGDRFLIRMFRTYLFRQVHDGSSWLELSHICGALNKVTNLRNTYHILAYAFSNLIHSARCWIGRKAYASFTR